MSLIAAWWCEPQMARSKRVVEVKKLRESMTHRLRQTPTGLFRREPEQDGPKWEGVRTLIKQQSKWKLKGRHTHKASSSSTHHFSIHRYCVWETFWINKDPSSSNKGVHTESESLPTRALRDQTPGLWKRRLETLWNQRNMLMWLGNLEINK